MNGSIAIHDHLDAALGANRSLHVLGEALELSPATRGLLGAHSQQVHLLPAADATLVGVAVGIALSGGRAVVELADPSALWGALPQLTEAVALSSTESPVRLVVRVPFGPDQASVAPDALLAALPGLSVAVAGRPADCAALLAEALDHAGPTVILESRAALAGGSEVGSEAAPGFGKAAQLREGQHATLLTWGAGIAACAAAADQLADDGISVDILDLRWLSPLDRDRIGARINQTGRPVVVGASAGPLLAAVQSAFLRLESPPARVEDPDVGAIVAAVRGSVHF